MQAKRLLNYWNKMLTAAKSGAKEATNTKGESSQKPSTSTTNTIPTGSRGHPAWLGYKPSHRKQSPTGRTQVVATWAEDPGVVKMSEKSPMTVRGIQTSINRYHALQGKSYLKDKNESLRKYFFFMRWFTDPNYAVDASILLVLTEADIGTLKEPTARTVKEIHERAMAMKLPRPQP